MAKITIVTGFDKPGFELYGRKFLDTFNIFWPEEVDLAVYVNQENGSIPLPVLQGPLAGRRAIINILPRAAFDFRRRHKDNLAAHGKAPRYDGIWKPRELEAGYCFRFDAIKFSMMAMQTSDAAQFYLDQPDDIMIWLDADTVTFSNITVDFLLRQLGDADTCYLGRGTKHSECGFVMFRGPRGQRLAHDWGNYYDNDSVFGLQEWHSSYVYDIARKVLEAKRQITSKDMTPEGTGHVWFQSELGTVMDHLKGKRKEKGSSTELRK